MEDSPSIKSHLKSLEAQLRVIEGLVGQSQAERASGGRSFGDLFGWLSGQAESSEEEIDAILYKLPPRKRTTDARAREAADPEPSVGG